MLVSGTDLWGGTSSAQPPAATEGWHYKSLTDVVKLVEEKTDGLLPLLSGWLLCVLLSSP